MAEERAAPTSSITPTSSNIEMESTQNENGFKPNDSTVKEPISGSTEEGAGQAAASEDAKPNGHTNHDLNETSEKPSIPAEDLDIEMGNAGEAGDAAGATSSPAVPAATGTPASSKRASTGGSSKKKSAAVPEHKTKKLNKKKSKPMTNLHAQSGEYFLSRMKGHPPWPSIICDEEMLPQSLLGSRPVTAMLPDGSFRKPEYADGGKRVYERTFPVMFLHTNEFAWIPNTELTPLDITIDSTQNPSEKGKSKLLLAAYAKASEGNTLDYFKTMLAEHQRALQEDQEEKAERAAKKGKKAIRKSSDAVPVEDDADDMDIDEVTNAEKPKSKKRKKTDDSDLEEKPAKTPKTLKISAPKAPAAESSGKKKTPKSKTAKSKAAKSGSDDEPVSPKVEEKPLSPAAAKEIKEKKVFYYRHKLQRGFLSRDTVPKEEEMKFMSDFLSGLETFADLEGSIIRTTKIHKVLRAIIKLQSIPLDEEFHFKDRSMELLEKWNNTLSNEPATGDKDDDKDADKDGDKANETKPAATNGHGKAVEEQAEKADVGEAATPKEEQLEGKIDAMVEGEEEAEKPKRSEAAEPQKTAEEEKTDVPAVDSALAEEYKLRAAEGTENKESAA